MDERQSLLTGRKSEKAAAIVEVDEGAAKKSTNNKGKKETKNKDCSEIAVIQTN